MPEMDLNLLWGLVLLVAIASFTAYYANRRGREPLLWFAIGLLLGIFSPLILLLLPVVKKENGDSPRVDSPPESQDNEKVAEGMMPEEDRLWYYLDQQHQQFGPVSIVALRALWNRGRLELTHYVWTEGMEKWEKVENMPDLHAVLNREGKKQR